MSKIQPRQTIPLNVKNETLAFRVVLEVSRGKLHDLIESESLALKIIEVEHTAPKKKSETVTTTTNTPRFGNAYIDLE